VYTGAGKGVSVGIYAAFGLTTKPATEIISRREEQGERRVHGTYTSETSDVTTQKELSGRLSITRCLF
jgi:hypothetical protein